MNEEYLFALLQVRQFHMYLAVETSCAQQCRVQYIRTVGCRQNDHAAIGAEAVHLCQQLVQRTLALIVAARHRILPAGTADSVYLINKDDSRRFLFGLAEEVTHTAGSYAHKHLYEIRSAHREERHIRFSGYCFGEQGLSCSRRAYKKSSFRDLGSYLCVFLRVLQEFDYFLYFLFRPVEACHIREGHFVLLVLVEQLRLRFAHAEDTAGTAACSNAAAHIHEEQHD